MPHVLFHNCKCNKESFEQYDNDFLRFRLQKQLNNALQQAGLFTINMTVFNVEEAVDNLG